MLSCSFEGQNMIGYNSDIYAYSIAKKNIKNGGLL